MAIFPGGKSTRVNSPRHLTIRHARRVVAATQREARRALRRSTAPNEEDSEDDDLAQPLPGQQELKSYWAPGLDAGQKHRVTVSQSIQAPENQQLALEAEQDFFVDAPQFSLPDGSVHSTYPPAGYSDDHRILPHIVLTDPHLPWERLGSPQAGSNAQLREKVRLMAAGSSDAPVRNRVPWLVMFSFSQDELRLSPGDLVSIFANTSAGVIKPVKQSPTMAVNMSIEDLWKLTGVVTTPVKSPMGPPDMKDSRGDFIFVPSDLFTSLFSTYDSQNRRVVPSNPDTSQYAYLAHVRNINGSGMALAGVEDTAVFSIVLGNRSGPLDIVAPTTMCAHLVSIEGVEAMDFPADSQRYVAMCSLYSWNYTVLPPNTLNVPDAFQHLGRTLQVLRAPDSIIDPLRKSSDKMEQHIAKRLDDGFTLVKYLTQTGEPTVAFYRGPFTPTFVSGLDNLTQCSNTGIDLQILDKDLGIMDITYSVAWQIGRTMALGDEAYTAALGRLRTSIHKPAVGAVKLQMVKDINDHSIRTRTELLSDLSNMVKGLAAIHIEDKNNVRAPAPGQPSFNPGGAKKRWHRRLLGRAEQPNLSFTSPSIQARYPDAALKEVRKLARSKSGGLYNETNDPESTDWMIVLLWLVDRMFLVGVPAHCLIPDPTYLETESLRFFRIDNYWVDALIDGALSLGNHCIVDDDRVEIKQALNDYISHIPEGLSHPIQIPSYGFYLRSDLVTMFPDLRVEVLPDGKALQDIGQDLPAGAPLLRHEIVTDGVMMGFMDRVPGSADFGSLVFTQPAHQQRFAVARGLGSGQIKVDMRRQYTVDQTTRMTDDDRHLALKSDITYTPSGDNSTDNIFIWNSQPSTMLNDLRILRLPQFANLQLEILNEYMGTYDDGGQKRRFFQDDTATSALFSMQMNDPIYNLTIDLRPHPPESTLARLGPLSNTSPEVRTLKRLTPARINAPFADRQESQSDTAPSAQPGNESSIGNSNATFTRHPNYVPSSIALSTNLGPHVRATRLLSPNDLSTPTTVFSPPNTGQDDTSAAEAPRYKTVVSSNNGIDWDTIILGEHNLAQDLIFSITVEHDKASKYLLTELDIQITFGPSGRIPNLLMPKYDGPGTIMLTNLRFNAFHQVLNDNGETVLRLRLLPRAAKGWVDIDTVKDLSFLLGLATLNTQRSYPYQAYIQSWATYCIDPNDPKLGPENTYKLPNPDVLVTVYDV